jgi:3-oxoadipate enol-lactonase
MVIVGSKDPATLPEFGEEIHKMIKGSTLTALDAAHLSNIEQAKAYTEAVLTFLTQK